MTPLNQFLNRTPQNFWIYNYVASLAFYIINGFRSFNSLLLFPIVVLLLQYVVENQKQVKVDRNYLGFFPLEREVGHLIIAGLLNYVIWHVSGLIFFICVIYLIWKQTR